MGDPRRSPKTPERGLIGGYEPHAGRGLPAVAGNGRYVGAAELGGTSYRQVELTAGQEMYIEVASVGRSYWVRPPLTQLGDGRDQPGIKGHKGATERVNHPLGA